MNLPSIDGWPIDMSGIALRFVDSGPKEGEWDAQAQRRTQKVRKSDGALAWNLHLIAVIDGVKHGLTLTTYGPNPYVFEDYSLVELVNPVVHAWAAVGKTGRAMGGFFYEVQEVRPASTQGKRSTGSAA